MSLLSSFFKTKKTPTYSGQRPYTSLVDSTGGQDYFNTIKARSQGQGVGYSPDYVDKASNPVIARMRNQFSSYDLPALKSELSATGRRRGSGGFDQLSRAYQTQGLNEEAAYAPIYQAAEEARRDDINKYTGDLGNFALNDANVRNTAANFDRSTFNDAVTTRLQDRKENDALAGNLIYAGLDFASPYVNSITSRMPMQTYGGQSFNVSTPPKGYDYKNIKTALGRVR